MKKYRIYLGHGECEHFAEEDWGDLSRQFLDLLHSSGSMRCRAVNARRGSTRFGVVGLSDPSGPRKIIL